MGKNSGSAYKMIEIGRLLDLAEEYLPLGKDEWERLPSDFNSTRPRSWVERDFDSLRRKFKVLYSTRKPTGKANIPLHIERAKDLKRAIDDKANVVEMDDCADEDSDAESDGEDEDQEENRPIEPAFSFDYDPDDSLFPDRGGEGGGVAVGVYTPTGVSLSSFIGPAALTDTTEITALDRRGCVRHHAIVFWCSLWGGGPGGARTTHPARHSSGNSSNTYAALGGVTQVKEGSSHQNSQVKVREGQTRTPSGCARRFRASW